MDVIVVGAGRMGANHVRALAAVGHRVAAFVDVDQERARVLGFSTSK